jgi:hypothetical protein
VKCYLLCEVLCEMKRGVPFYLETALSKYRRLILETQTC